MWFNKKIKSLQLELYLNNNNKNRTYSHLVDHKQIPGFFTLDEKERLWSQKYGSKRTPTRLEEVEGIKDRRMDVLWNKVGAESDMFS